MPSLIVVLKRTRPTRTISVRSEMGIVTAVLSPAEVLKLVEGRENQFIWKGKSSRVDSIQARPKARPNLPWLPCWRTTGSAVISPGSEWLRRMGYAKAA